MNDQKYFKNKCLKMSLVKNNEVHKRMYYNIL